MNQRSATRAKSLDWTELWNESWCVPDAAVPFHHEMQFKLNTSTNFIYWRSKRLEEVEVFKMIYWLGVRKVVSSPQGDSIDRLSYIPIGPQQIVSLNVIHSFLFCSSWADSSKPTVTWEEFLSILRLFLSLLFRKAKIPKNSRNVNGNLKSRYLCFRHLIWEWLVVMILFAHLSLYLFVTPFHPETESTHTIIYCLSFEMWNQKTSWRSILTLFIILENYIYLYLQKIHLQSPVSPTSCQLPEKWHCQREVGISGGTSLRA